MYKYKPLKENEVIIDKVNEGFPIGFIQMVGDNILDFLKNNPQAGTPKLFYNLSYLFYVVCEVCNGATMKELGIESIRECIEELTRDFWNLGGHFDNGSIVAIHRTIIKDEAGQPEPKINTNEDHEEGTLPDIVDDMYSKRIENALDFIELNNDDTELRKVSKEIGSLISILVDHGNYIHSLIEINKKPERT